MPIALESPDQPDVIALIAELDAYQDSLYPPESRHALDLGVLVQPHVLFAVARDAAGQAVGCGAVVLEAQEGELKRMFVHGAARGTGVGRALLDAVETLARDRGIRTLRLETGEPQADALRLYERAGFVRIPPFGEYVTDPTSVCLEKVLTSRAPTRA